MKETNHTRTKKSEKGILPLHSLDNGSMQINILPLDHTNPYDFKREHRHTYFEIILIQDGGCNQLIDFINYPGRDYSCYIICPQQIHLMNRNNASGTVFQFTEDRVESTELRASLRQLLFYEKSAIIFEERPDLFDEIQLLINVLRTYLVRKDETNNQVVTHLLQSIISIMLDNSDLQDNSEKNPVKKLLIDFYLLIEVHYSENVGVQFYIDNLSTTEKKLAEATKKHTGLSPLQVIHNRVLLEAKRLMLFEDRTHKEISYQLGFDSPASFSSFIKSKTGLAPVELTKQLAGIHK
jgi:AraC family transcriptional activator of pobA